jgi:hypothetical protein
MSDFNYGVGLCYLEIQIRGYMNLHADSIMHLRKGSAFEVFVCSLNEVQLMAYTL